MLIAGGELQSICQGICPFTGLTEEVVQALAEAIAQNPNMKNEGSPFKPTNRTGLTRTQNSK